MLEPKMDDVLTKELADVLFGAHKVYDSFPGWSFWAVLDSNVSALEMNNLTGDIVLSDRASSPDGTQTIRSPKVLHLCKMYGVADVPSLLAKLNKQNMFPKEQKPVEKPVEKSETSGATGFVEENKLPRPKMGDLVTQTLLTALFGPPKDFPKCELEWLKYDVNKEGLTCVNCRKDNTKITLVADNYVNNPTVRQLCDKLRVETISGLLELTNAVDKFLPAQEPKLVVEKAAEPVQEPKPEAKQDEAPIVSIPAPAMTDRLTVELLTALCGPPQQYPGYKDWNRFQLGGGVSHLHADYGVDINYDTRNSTPALYLLTFWRSEVNPTFALLCEKLKVVDVHALATLAGKPGLFQKESRMAQVVTLVSPKNDTEFFLNQKIVHPGTVLISVGDYMKNAVLTVADGRVVYIGGIPDPSGTGWDHVSSVASKLKVRNLLDGEVVSISNK